MRGGAIPLAAWGTILLVLYVIHAIWDPRGVPLAATGVAVLVVYGGSVLLWLAARKQAFHRGPPTPPSEPEALPEASLSAVLIALAAATILFGFVWASFLVYFGAGLLVLSLGRMAVELRSQRESRAHAERGRSQ